MASCGFSQTPDGNQCACSGDLKTQADGLGCTFFCYQVGEVLDEAGEDCRAECPEGQFISGSDFDTCVTSCGDD